MFLPLLESCQLLVEIEGVVVGFQMGVLVSYQVLVVERRNICWLNQYLDGITLRMLLGILASGLVGCGLSSRFGLAGSRLCLDLSS